MILSNRTWHGGVQAYIDLGPQHHFLVNYCNTLSLFVLQEAHGVSTALYGKGSARTVSELLDEVSIWSAATLPPIVQQKRSLIRMRFYEPENSAAAVSVVSQASNNMYNGYCHQKQH